MSCFRFVFMPEQTVRYVTELSECIKVKSSDEDDDDSSEFVKFFPSFIWAVRDFTLQLKIDGKDTTEDEYLEFALKLKHGNLKILQKVILRALIITITTSTCYCVELFWYSSLDFLSFSILCPVAQAATLLEQTCFSLELRAARECVNLF